MIWHKDNIQHLHQGKLTYRDTIIFPSSYSRNIQYKVHRSYLECIHNMSNQYIFRELGIGADESWKLCHSLYGYRPYNTMNHTESWPVCSMNDYNALTRVVKHLFNIILNNPLITTIPDQHTLKIWQNVRENISTPQIGENYMIQFSS